MNKIRKVIKITKEQQIMKGNVKLSVFNSFPYEDFNEICDAIVKLGYTGTIVDNGNVSFQKREPVTNPSDEKKDKK